MRESLKKIDTVEQTKIPVKDFFEYDYSEIRKQPEYRKSGIMAHFWEHSWIQFRGHLKQNSINI
ncbi:hypothetical protein GCM10011418_11030 [Sphingobacterium alkalisoli]|nr:hypothetical protein GCM10011418_11030 [Sphingobacterium alkalisoli]